MWRADTQVAALRTDAHPAGDRLERGRGHDRSGTGRHAVEAQAVVLVRVVHRRVRELVGDPGRTRCTRAQELAQRRGRAAGRPGIRVEPAAVAHGDHAPAGPIPGHHRAHPAATPARLPHGRAAHSRAHRGGQDR